MGRTHADGKGIQRVHGSIDRLLTPQHKRRYSTPTRITSGLVLSNRRMRGSARNWTVTTTAAVTARFSSRPDPHHLAGPLDLTGSHALAYHGGDGLSDGPAVHPGKGVDLQSYAGGSGH